MLEAMEDHNKDHELQFTYNELYDTFQDLHCRKFSFEKENIELFFGIQIFFFF